MNHLREYFSSFGDITEVQIPCLENGKKRGFGIVQFASIASAATALKQLNATTLLGMYNILCTNFVISVFIDEVLVCHTDILKSAGIPV